MRKSSKVRPVSVKLCLASSVSCSARASSAIYCAEVPASNSSSTSGTKPVTPRGGMSMWRPCACRVPRGGKFCGGGIVMTIGSGNSTGPSSHPTGPRKQDKAIRPPSVAVNSRPSTTVAIIGDTAAQATDPMPYQTSGVGPRRAAGGNGILGAVDCARAELWAPTTVAITTIAAVATRRMGTPQPAADMGILHRV